MKFKIKILLPVVYLVFLHFTMASRAVFFPYMTTLIHFSQKDPENGIALLSSKINKQYILIQQQEKQKMDLQSNLLNSKLDNKGEKLLFRQIENITKIIDAQKEKLNCYLHAQTLAQQLQYLPNYKKTNAIEDINSLLTKIEKNKINYKKATKTYQIINYSDKVVNYLPEPDCKLESTQDGKVLANQFSPLFNYTPNEIEKHYTSNDFLQTYTRLLKSGKKYFIEFKFEFNSPKAVQLYGIIEESSPLKLSFLDDDYIYLLNGVTAPPEQQLSTGTTLYKMQCQISKSALNKLSKKEVDQLTVLWPSGAETYELNHLHVYQNLIACLRIKT